MIRYILVPATGRGIDRAVFETALAVARMFAAHLAFLHVRVDVKTDIAVLAYGDVIAASGLAEMEDMMEREAASREQAAMQGFRDFCTREQLPILEAPASPALSAEWRTETGEERQWLAEHGRVADLLVIGRDRDNYRALENLEGALLGSGRPVLIAAAKLPPAMLATVAIAWKNTPETARAVASALPFIEKSERVIIFTIDEHAEGADQPSERLLHALRWHNPNIVLQRMKRQDCPPVETLLEAAARAESDLLVMGGYSHSRLRETVFGGFTRRVLAAAELPVLMMH
jgi:nucleotide-binding universal stress UspA family protein